MESFRNLHRVISRDRVQENASFLPYRGSSTKYSLGASTSQTIGLADGARRGEGGYGATTPDWQR
jgi:hypothetical protein